MRSFAKKFYSINFYYKIAYYTLYILGLGNRKLFNSIYTSFVRKQGCPTIYFLMTRNYLKKMFSAILDLEKTNRVQNVFFEKITKDRVSHFNISVAVKRRSIDEHGQT